LNSVIATFAREFQVKGQVGKGNVHTRQQQALCGALLNELKISNLQDGSCTAILQIPTSDGVENTVVLTNLHMRWPSPDTPGASSNIDTETV
jgi:hypothetical protein